MSVRAAAFLHRNHVGSLFKRQVPGSTTAIRNPKLSKLGPVTCTTGGTAMHVGQLVELGNCCGLDSVCPGSQVKVTFSPVEQNGGTESVHINISGV